MKKVIIYEIKTPSMKSTPIIEVCFSNNIITFTGDDKIITNLKTDGISDKETGKILFPSDGIDFLENLKHAFKNPYLSATDILNTD